MAQKRYYWLKLQNNFFQDIRMKKLRKIAGGDTITIIYLKMQLLSLANNGTLFYEDLEESFAEEIALQIDEDIENVKLAITYLMNVKLLEQVEADEYILTETIKNIGSESESAERVRQFRAKKEQKSLQCNTNVTLIRDREDKELELDEDIKEEEIKILSLVEINFNKFWELYPKKVSKQEAFKSFKKIKMDAHLFNLILSQLRLFKKTKNWNKDNGQFIPHASTWLNQKRWEDEIQEKDIKELTTKDIAENMDFTNF